jgi:broad specificity phosphatase PhoE
VSDKTVVHLVRHGEVHNPEKVLYERLDGFELSDLGHEMARTTAKAFTNRDVTEIITSPLTRAKQTAKPIAEQLGLPISIDERIIEAGNVFAGKRVSVGDGALRDPRNWWHLRDPFTPSWGEPYTQVAGRMRDAIAGAREKATGREIVLVSHQLPIWMARLDAEGRRLPHNPRSRQCTLASVTSLVFDGSKLVALEYQEPSAYLLPIKR